MTPAQIASTAFAIRDWSMTPDQMQDEIREVMCKSVPRGLRPKRIRNPQIQPRQAKVRERNRAMSDMRDGGATVAQICEAFGMTYDAVRQCLRDHRALMEFGGAQ